MSEDVPDLCEHGNHEFEQGGRCRFCGIDRVDTLPNDRRTGGAGARTNPCTDREYRKEMREIAMGEK